MGAGSEIIVCDKRFDVGQRVITWKDDPSINAYTPHRTDNPKLVPPFHPAKGMDGATYRFRARGLIGADRSLERLKQVIKQFVIHHDGCMSSRDCFNVLHNERGLSVHFLIDNDGTIFQTLDLVDCAFQAAGVNEISVGVELANRGDAALYKDAYKGKRDKLTCRINGHQFLAYEYTKAQIESMISIGKALARIFPNLPQTFPANAGDQMWNTLAAPREYSGYLGHYHVTDNKWDPGPFDFKYFSSKIRGRTVYPLVLSGDKTAKPEIPDDPYKAEDIANQFYENNETEGEGGYYPVGPLGESRLWHGGVHIRAEKGTPIYAPFGGKVVAARMTADDELPIGSRNFVLIKHELAVGPSTIKFWTLFFHLMLESPGSKDAPAWYAKYANQFGDDPIGISPAIDVAAGDVVGHVGEAGPPGRTEGQVHVEVMSADELGEKVQPDFWHLVEGAGMGRFCNAPEIVGKIDHVVAGRKDNVLSRAEVLQFYRSNPAREEFRKLAVHHVSEWANDNDWEVALNKSRDFANLPKPVRARMYREQIEPVLWWTEEVANAAELPSDKVVWNYHPITFILWLHDRMKNAQASSAGIGSAADFAGTRAPSNIKDDGDATEGFTDDEDVLFGEAGKKLELEDLANGFPDEKEKK